MSFAEAKRTRGPWFYTTVRLRVTHQIDSWQRWGKNMQLTTTDGKIMVVPATAKLQVPRRRRRTGL